MICDVATNLWHFRLVHHSRNTEEKQWNETIKVAVTNATRVFKQDWNLAVLYNLQHQNDIEAHFAKLFGFLQRAGEKTAPEVAVVRCAGLHV